MNKEILDSIAEDIFSTLPLIGRSIHRKLIKTVVTGFEEDITPPHFQIMKLLQEHGTMHVAEIGEHLHIARPQMTHLIDRLVELKIVDREINQEDRRMLNIALSAKGKEMIKEQDKRVIRATTEALVGLTEAELQQLSNSVKMLKDIFSKLD
ncbi:MAG: MarR family transcriptional regulator [Dehalococcoidales bacterium]|nr:MarR family transcriptional regulator [Dehalococcoidales bacterium]